MSYKLRIHILCSFFLFLLLLICWQKSLEGSVIVYITLLCTTVTWFVFARWFIPEIAFDTGLEGHLTYAWPLPHSSSQRRLAREATAMVLHLAQSAAALEAMSSLSHLNFRSFYTVRPTSLLFVPSFSCTEVSIWGQVRWWSWRGHAAGVSSPPPSLHFFCQSIHSSSMRWCWASKSWECVGGIWSWTPLFQVHIGGRSTRYFWGF